MYLDNIINKQMNDIQTIDAIARGIMASYYGSRQRCGTETQKWTYAILQAREIFSGDSKINENDLSDEAFKYCKKHELI
jgi:hypothetical protein